jgi:hypothetical protein
MLGDDLGFLFLYGCCVCVWISNLFSVESLDGSSKRCDEGEVSSDSSLAQMNDF